MNITKEQIDSIVNRISQSLISGTPEQMMAAVAEMPEYAAKDARGREVMVAILAQSNCAVMIKETLYELLLESHD